MIYDPAEDSFLLQKHVKNHSRKTGRTLDMGTGSGILAASAKGNVEAVDISKRAIDYCKARHKKIRFYQSNLFSRVRGTFDLIIFNPPYLPNHPVVRERALDGGKHGYELLVKFLDQANKHLESNGKILILFSSLTKKDKIDQALENNCFSFKCIDTLKLDFETLYIYLIQKSDLLKKLEKRNITNIIKFARGHRGILYTGIYKKKKVAIKSQRPGITASTIQNEITKLKVLNKHKIGPRLRFHGSDYFAYDFIAGEFIVPWTQKNNKTIIKKILVWIIKQLHTMDKLNLNKEEMTNPYKHIIINTKPWLIDFERCRTAINPKNITQFCQFLASSNYFPLLKKKGFGFTKEQIITAAKHYKKTLDIKPIIQLLHKTQAFRRQQS